MQHPQQVPWSVERQAPRYAAVATTGSVSAGRRGVLPLSAHSAMGGASAFRLPRAGETLVIEGVVIVGIGVDGAPGEVFYHLPGASTSIDGPSAGKDDGEMDMLRTLRPVGAA